jgi:hypothetical protein
VKAPREPRARARARARRRSHSHTARRVLTDGVLDNRGLVDLGLRRGPAHVSGVTRARARHENSAAQTAHDEREWTREQREREIPPQRASAARPAAKRAHTRTQPRAAPAPPRSGRGPGARSGASSSSALATRASGVKEPQKSQISLKRTPPPTRHTAPCAGGTPHADARGSAPKQQQDTRACARCERPRARARPTCIAVALLRHLVQVLPAPLRGRIRRAHPLRHPRAGGVGTWHPHLLLGTSSLAARARARARALIRHYYRHN